MKKNQHWQKITEMLFMLSPALYLLLPQDALPASLCYVYAGLSLFSALSVLIVWKVSQRKIPRTSEKPLWRTILLIPCLEYALILCVSFPQIGLDPSYLALIFIGLILIVLGNILPSIEPNLVFGIRTKYTLQNRENWRITHRISGWLWVSFGLLVWLCILLKLSFWIGYILLILAALAPIVISHAVHAQQKKQGTWSVDDPQAAGLSKKGTLLVCIVLAAVGVLSGGAIVFGKEYSITADHGCVVAESLLSGGAKIPAESIEQVSLIEKPQVGRKQFGYQAFGISLGTFSNDEYGRYTRFTSNTDHAVEIRTEKGIYILSLDSDEKTEELHRKIEAMTQ